MKEIEIYENKQYLKKWTCPECGHKNPLTEWGDVKPSGVVKVQCWRCLLFSDLKVKFMGKL